MADDGRPAFDLVRPLAAVVVRLVAMVVCAAALTFALSAASDAVLPLPGSLGQTFDRFGASVALSLVLGAALGGVLTHRFGRTAYLPVSGWASPSSPLVRS